MDTKDLGVMLGGVAAVMGLALARSRSGSLAESTGTVADRLEKEIEEDAAGYYQAEKGLGRDMRYQRDSAYAGALMRRPLGDDSDPYDGMSLPEVYKELAYQAVATTPALRAEFYENLAGVSDRSAVKSRRSSQKLLKMYDDFHGQKVRELDAMHKLVMKAVEARHRLEREGVEKSTGKSHLTIVR